MKLSRILLGLGVLVGVIIQAMVIYFVFTLLHRVTPEQAQTASQKHLEDVKTKISSVPGYVIVRQDKPSVFEQQDEVGSMDYIISADFLVQKSPTVSTAETLQADMRDLAQRLPANDYGITVENLPQKPDQPGLMCVSASRYLNDDGSFIPQGSAANISKYTSLDEPDRYTNRCDDLLK